MKTAGLVASVLFLGLVLGVTAAIPAPPAPGVAPAPTTNPANDLAQRMRHRRLEAINGAPPAPLSGASAAPGLATATAPAALLNNPAATQPAINWPDLLARLGSAEFEVREKAQQDLGKVDYRQRDTIKRLMDAADDEEVRSRLEKRLEEIADQLAIDPPPISLNIKDASLGQTTAALSKALNVPLGCWPPQEQMGFNPDRFTLQVTDKPFWDIFNDLSRQHGLQFQNYGNDGLRLSIGGSPWQCVVRSGGFAIIPQSATRSASVNYQNPAGQEIGHETMNFNCLIMADPRIKIVRYAEPQFTEVTDDAGNALLQRNNNPNRYWNSSRSQSYWNVYANLNVPQNLGKKIASARGVAYFEVQLAAETVEVADFETKFQTPVAIGGRTLTFSKFEIKQGSINLECSLSNAPRPMRFFPGQDNVEPLSVEMRLVDANGKSIVYTLSGGMSGGWGGGYTSPIKLQVSIPTKTKQFTVPFELKDLVLPQSGQP
jgi:hypothetical protein